MTLPNDPMFSQQWHLFNPTSGLLDLNIVYSNGVNSIWDDYTGAGVDVFIIDDAFDYNHVDLDGNYDQNRDFDYEGNDNDPFGLSAESHGTSVIGIIGAEGNNGIGVTGIAFGSTIVGYQVNNLIGDPWLQNIRDAIADAATNGADVLNISQGIANDATSEFGNGYNALRFVEIDNSINSAVTSGRGGLGTVIVKSAGNSRTDFYDVNSDPWTNNTQQIVVAAVDQNGYVSSYSSFGAANLISAFGTPGEVLTTDRSGGEGYNLTDYNSSFNGTSSAAPMVSGIVALMLEANPDLGWRDIQSILAYSARHVGSAVDNSTTAGSEYTPWDWNAATNWNGGGLHFSNDYGYGLIDALAAVRLAETWLEAGIGQTSANEASTFEDGLNVPTIIPDGNLTGTSFTIVEATSIIVERVTVEITFSTTALADMEIYLTSPDGVEHLLIRDQAGGASFNGTYTFESQAFRGEGSDGVWVVRIVDDAGADTLTITDIGLRTYGQATTANDRFVFTNEFSDFAGVGGHNTVFAGGTGINTINTSAVTSDTTIDLVSNSGMIDGVAVTISQVTRVFTGDGNDSITGNGADNHILGGYGMDTVNGGDGSDWLYGQGGDDIINAGAGAMDVSLGDDGNDTINGEAGMDYMYGYAGNDTAHGGDGDDVAYGGAGNDELYGDDGADWLFGEAGNDKLFGGVGADLLMGGAGVDEITGGSGNDWMWGGDMAGAGDGAADTFFFGAAWGGDVIWDFENGSDMLDVSGAGITSFADLTVGTFGDFATITSADGDIIYLRGAGNLAVAESSIDASDFIFA